MTTNRNAEKLWLPVLDYETDYEVSDQGDVRRSTPGRGARAGHVLRPYLTRLGYRQVALRRDGRTRSRLVAHLVCEAFHGPRPAGMEVRHLDGNSQNDVPANLAWGTHYENVQDIRRHGTHRNTKKTHCVNGHEFTAQNTYQRVEGGRRCRTCGLVAGRKSKAKRQAAANA